jgi:hypothetical protein
MSAILIVISLILFILLIIGSITTSIRIFKIITIKQLLIFAVVVIAMYSIITYYNYQDESESFRQGVMLLKVNKNITDKIGYFSSYSFNENNMPDEKDDPASFQISLKGDKAIMYLQCKMTKDKLGNWHFIEIKQDSICAFQQ